MLGDFSQDFDAAPMVFLNFIDNWMYAKAATLQQFNG